MFTFSILLTFTSARRLLPCICLAGLLLICGTAAAHAQETAPAEPEPCESCHSPETEAWMASPHAAIPADSDEANATCEACHGPYVKGHPDNGVVDLRVDSSLCRDCHADTFVQWQDSIHARADVQCISCHQSHSQTLRLTDEQLCRACHKESLTDPFHTAHWYTEVACIACHMAETPQPGALAMRGDATVDVMRASHDFTTVSADNCLMCHREDVANPAERQETRDLTLTLLQEQRQQLAELDAQLDSSRRAANSLRVLTPMTLGFGIGVGGILGIVFMLVVARMERKEMEGQDDL